MTRHRLMEVSLALAVAQASMMPASVTLVEPRGPLPDMYIQPTRKPRRWPRGKAARRAARARARRSR